MDDVEDGRLSAGCASATGERLVGRPTAAHAPGRGGGLGSAPQSLQVAFAYPAVERNRR